MTDIIHVKGRKIDQKKLRKFLDELDTSNIDQFLTDDGMWESPVTGELFRTKHQLWGHLGAYLRTIKHKDPKEPTRAGYVRALRRWARADLRAKGSARHLQQRVPQKRKDRIARAKGIDPDVAPVEKATPPRRVPAMSME